MKVLVGAFSQERALVGVIVKSARRFVTISSAQCARHQPYWWWCDGANTCYMRRWRGAASTCRRQLPHLASCPWPASPLPGPCWGWVVVVVVTCVTRGWARVGEGRQRVGGGLRLLPSSTLYTSHNTHHRLPHHRPAQPASHTLQPEPIRINVVLGILHNSNVT